MTDEKLIAVFQYYDHVIGIRFGFSHYAPERAEGRNEKLVQSASALGKWLRHVRWMCVEAQTFVADGRREKAMRWLGFVQGYLFHAGEFSIDELANHSRPDEPTNAAILEARTIPATGSPWEDIHAITRHCAHGSFSGADPCTSCNPLRRY